MSGYMSRMFPKSNSSLLLQSGTALKATVHRVRDDKYLVDAGIGAPKLCLREALTVVPADKSVFQNKVGFMGPPGAETEVNKGLLERYFIDIVAGDATNEAMATARAVIKKLHEVDRLISSGDFQIEPINGQSFTKSVEWMPTISLDGQAKAEEQLQQLMEFSNAENIRAIAVWGMGGVGKTTRVKKFNNRLVSSSNSKLFDMVIWVHEARDLDVESVQSHIAKRMNYKLDAEDSTQRRAIKLYNRLLNFKQVLIIFDDIWKKIDLDVVGIPYRFACCKVLLITRSYTVCREMEVEQDAIIKVDVLNEDTAWKLFVDYAGPVVESEHIKPWATKILRKCGGLPLAIKTIGRSMAHKAEIALWKNAVSQLCRAVPHLESFEKDVLLTLQVSINHLPQVYRACLQYCSLYPENFSIKTNELVNCWFADGLIDEHASLEDVVNSGFATVEYLKNACMLECGEVIGTVKMHGLLRDAAIKVFLKKRRVDSFVNQLSLC